MIKIGDYVHVSRNGKIFIGRAIRKKQVNNVAYWIIDPLLPKRNTSKVLFVKESDLEEINIFDEELESD